MSLEKFTSSCQHAVKEVAKEETLTVIVRTKLQAMPEAATRSAAEALLDEQLATRRGQLLARIHQRYGTGRQFFQQYEDSRRGAHKRIVEQAPQATDLWLSDAVAVTGTRAEIEDLATHEDVESVDLNQVFELPRVLRTPLEDTPGVIDGSAWGVAKIRAPEVWGGYGRGEKVLVGHLDTGVDPTHPALAGHIAAFEEFDVIGNPLGTAPHDSAEHGTHTAGTICGRNFNGINIGVAPEAQLVSALVLNGGSGTFAQIISGMQWAIGKNVHVMNMSLGGKGYTPLWNLPVLNATLAGVLVVASIGNDGQTTSGGPGNDLFALGVGATHFQDTVVGFSGGQSLVGVWHNLLSPIFGPLTYMKPEISAPGAEVLSSVPRSEVAAFNGTSMAAPHAAGAAALVQSANPKLMGDPFAVRAIFLATTEDFGEAGRDQRFGFGRLDALAAVQTAVSLA